MPRDLVPAAASVHNGQMRRTRGRSWWILAGLVLAGCGDAATRRLPEGGPDESAAPAGAIVGGGKEPARPDTTGTAPTATVAPCPPPSPPSEACDAASFQAVPPPLGLYLMIDRSGSMNGLTSGGVTKWQALTDALQDFLESPPVPSLSAAAQFFPASGNLCEPAMYEQPAVSLGPAGSVRGPILSSMTGVIPEGPTPTAAALAGAIEQTRKWARQQPKTSFAVVLASDGLPSSCDPVSAEGLRALAAEGAKAKGKDPPVPTFVIGILGVNDLGSGAMAVLDAIAQGGGTGKATRLSPSADLAGQMATALRAVAGQRVACSFKLPSAVATDADLSKLNVVLTGSCGRIELPYANGSCSGDGWSYDLDPKSGFPRAVELCPVSCERYRAGDQATVEVGCDTKGWPPG